MAINFKTPEAVATEYLLHLKALRPNENTDQTDSDWWIKGQVLGGVVSGLYADQRRMADDAFPQSARREALAKHLELWFNDNFKQPTQSNGFVLIKGPDGATGGIASAGTLELVYEPNGNSYVNTEDISIVAASGQVVAVQSIGTGQIQNLLEGALLTVSSPPAGIDTEAEVYSGPLADGRDVETNEEAAERILQRVREPIRGGTAVDYEQWALEADDSVVSANVLRYPQGFGSVGVIVAAGTTDIDAALDNGDPIVLVPSAELIQLVQDYLDARRPLTDYVIVYSPTEIAQDVTIKVKYAQGDGSTILDGQTLTQEELVIKEVKRALYKTPAGGRRIGATGFILASEIEEVVDLGLSASPYAIGGIEMLLDRQVEDLSASGANRMVLNNEIVTPGTISVVEMY